MIVGFLVYKCLGWLICGRPHTHGVIILVFLVRNVEVLSYFALNMLAVFGLCRLAHFNYIYRNVA